MQARLDHERLDVYQLLLRFITWVTRLTAEVKRDSNGNTGEVCSQLDRASLSALLNTAEGNGKRRSRTRARFFDDARGSSTECAACLDALVAKGMSTSERIAEGKEMLVRIVSMLTKLVQRYSDVHTARESAEEYETACAATCGFEDEDDDEDEDDCGDEGSTPSGEY